MPNYRLFGLNIKLPFTDEVLTATDGAPDVIVEFKKEAPFIESSAHQFHLSVKNVAEYYIENGSHISIIADADADADAELSSIRLFLLGSAMGSLLHQRQLLVLHGCAVEFAQGVVVFVAESGTGKSTLASHFYQNGFPVFCDDQSVVDVNNHLLVAPGLAQIKLWQHVLNEHNIDNANLQKVHVDHDKYIYPIKQDALQAKPLIAVVELSIDNQYQFKSQQGRDKLNVLVTHTYRNQYLSALNLLQQHFLYCAEVANQVAIFKATRPTITASSAEFFQFILQQLQLQGIEPIAKGIEANVGVGVVK